ncbi:MAG: 50S ribosomal protein L4 [Chitinophagales bacterium]|nr:50S ribosomal protein L4 [Chitinophagales bacterium]
MKIDIVNIAGGKTGNQVELNDEIFGIEPNDHAIYLAVKQYLANQRQGTHKTKDKGEVAGSTRKLHRQKGTGGARKGSAKNPMYRSGGTFFGPRPRDYSFKLNKKVKDLARRSALAYKAKENGIVVVEDFKINAPKTKEYAGMLKSLGIAGKNTLLILSEQDNNILVSGRNIPRTEIMDAKGLNTYAIMKANCLILPVSAINVINEMMSNN